MAPHLEMGRAKPLGFFDEVEHKDTVYLTVVDKDRNAVSFINSLFAGFGSGILVPHRGFLLNNELTDFNFTPPSTGSTANSPAANKRPRSSMSPTIVMKNATASRAKARQRRAVPPAAR